MIARTARCCCQDCAITVEGEPTLNALCHCTSCKRRTGSAFGWSAYFPDGNVVSTRGTFHVYPGAEHGFNCNMRGSFNAASAQLARQRTLAFLAQHLRGETAAQP